MIHAYDKVYLERARAVLGSMLDYAVNILGYGADHFFDLFIGSGTAKLFENGDYTVITGVSGIELAFKVLEDYEIPEERRSTGCQGKRSPEYWAGWALAYYQWETSLSFRDITGFICIGRIIGMYSPYHEMDIRQFCDAMDEKYRAVLGDSNLKRIRIRCGLSQSELAALTEVPVRTIQQYEQKQKNINAAKAESLFRLSKALCCDPEELLEKTG